MNHRRSSVDVVDIIITILIGNIIEQPIDRDVSK
jgi:hypothetical protein